jgi:hypothetical protein
MGGKIILYMCILFFLGKVKQGDRHIAQFRYLGP